MAKKISGTATWAMVSGTARGQIVRFVRVKRTLHQQK
jgi:hypothetical protein